MRAFTLRSSRPSRQSARPGSPARAALVPTRAARLAGLRYVGCEAPGIRRARAGRGFRYLDARDRPVRDAATLARIRSLAIPPAWTSVWICASPRGHIQAVGRDARRRKQYRYHPRWREVRDGAKFENIAEFARRLPALRRRTSRDLRAPGLPKRKVVAAVVRLLEATLIRVGNEEYARQNRSFGLTTLRNHHASVLGPRVEFRFRGKSARTHVVRLSDRRLGRIVRGCQDLPGQQLFRYLDERGRPRSLGSSDVNAYLRAAMGSDFTAKDFRTWAATVLAASALAALPPPRGKKQGARNVTRAIAEVASKLGNTPAVCRRSYVHPVVIEGYLDGSLHALLGKGAEADSRGLRADESRVLAHLASRPR